MVSPFCPLLMLSLQVGLSLLAAQSVGPGWGNLSGLFAEAQGFSLELSRGLPGSEGSGGPRTQRQLTCQLGRSQSPTLGGCESPGARGFWTTPPPRSAGSRGSGPGFQGI